MDTSNSPASSPTSTPTSTPRGSAETSTPTSTPRPVLFNNILDNLFESGQDNLILTKDNKLIINPDKKKLLDNIKKNKFIELALKSLDSNQGLKNLINNTGTDIELNVTNVKNDILSAFNITDINTINTIFTNLNNITIPKPEGCDDKYYNIFKYIKIKEGIQPDTSTFESFNNNNNFDSTDIFNNEPKTLFMLMFSILYNIGLDDWIILLILYGLNEFITSVNNKIIDARLNMADEKNKIIKYLTEINDNKLNILKNINSSDYYNTNKEQISEAIRRIEELLSSSDTKNKTKLLNIKEFYTNIGKVETINMTCTTIDEIYNLILSDLYLKVTIDNLISNYNEDDIKNELILYKKNIGELQLLSLLKATSKMFIISDKVTLNLLPFIRAINNKSKSLINMISDNMSNEISDSTVKKEPVTNKYKLEDSYYNKYIKYKTKYINLKNNI